VQDNITVVFDASQKTSAIDYSEETAFDVLTEYKQGEGDVKVGSQFHMGSVYFDIPTYGRSILEFSDAENVSSGPITSGHIGIYPYISWEFYYRRIPAPFPDSTNSTLDVVISTLVVIEEKEFRIKISVSIDFNDLNYSYLDQYIGETGNFTFVIPYAYGVMLGNATYGTPIYPSKIENDTVYYEYENLTLQTLSLNDTCFIEYFNGSVVEWELNVSFYILEWTTFFEYYARNLTTYSVARISVDPEIRIRGNFIKKAESPPEEETEPSPSPGSEEGQEQSSKTLPFLDTNIQYIIGAIIIVSLVLVIGYRRIKR